MKNLHILLSIVAMALFMYQSYLAIAIDKVPAKMLTIGSHIIYTLIMLTGAIMLVPLLSIEGLSLQWMLAKFILLLVVISSSVKAFRQSTKPAERNMGIFIASVSFVGILVLGFVKPSNIF